MIWKGLSREDIRLMWTSYEYVLLSLNVYECRQLIGLYVKYRWSHLIMSVIFILVFSSQTLFNTFFYFFIDHLERGIICKVYGQNM
jgi:hypothetical protein